MSIFIDLIVIAIIILMAVISAKRGFVRVAVEVAGFVAAVILVFSVNGPLANLTYDKVIEPPIVNSVEKITQENVTVSLDATWEALPDFITSNADKLGISKENLNQNISENAEQTTEGIVKSISGEVLKPIIVNILKAVYAIIMMVVLIILVKFLARVINKLFSFSVIGKTNTALGGVLGAVKGLIIAWLFCSVVYLIISLTENGIWIFNNENIENTYIFKYLMNVIHI